MKRVTTNPPIAMMIKKIVASPRISPIFTEVPTVPKEFNKDEIAPAILEFQRATISI